MTDEQMYVEERMTTWDRVCQYSWAAPVSVFLLMMLHGIVIGGYDHITYLLLGMMVVLFGVSLVLHSFVLARKVKRLQAEFYHKNRRT